MKAVQELFSWLGRHPAVPHSPASEETIFTNLVIIEERGEGEGGDGHMSNTGSTDLCLLTCFQYSYICHPHEN